MTADKGGFCHYVALFVYVILIVSSALLQVDAKTSSFGKGF
jgi:hypothetical protein